jgi:hypothetical protein
MYIEDCLVVKVIADNFVEDKIDLTALDAEEHSEECDSDDEEYSFEVNVVKFDTTCSRNMSGTTERIDSAVSNKNNIRIQGFNGTTSNVDAVGVNADGKLEYYAYSSYPTQRA